MHFGDIEVLPIHGGNFYLDGGAMFGVVPKTLWEKKAPADERNRVRLAANSLLLRANRRNILVETGNGTKWDPKLRNIYGIQDGDPLRDSLERAGVTLEKIDMVINTHLHFDHAGGNTHPLNDRDVPTFPNAQYVVQRGELEHAMNPTERDRASYFADRIVPVTEAGQWQLVDGDARIVPGVSVVRIPGHNADIQAVKISGGYRTLLFVADMLPTRHHLPLAWMPGYDLYPLQTLETKRARIAEIVNEGWIVGFGHDPDYPAATLHQRNGKIEFEPVDLSK
ncbi:MAG: MBL fold metallo-hydrolase [Acidobacteriota bacterium]|nr:MBL fold metallo-hydrolase [Acidobacteriota bacterium]